MPERGIYKGGKSQDKSSIQEDVLCEKSTRNAMPVKNAYRQNASFIAWSVKPLPSDMGI